MMLSYSRSTIGLEDCWAKTDEDGVPCLSVKDHCLVVGVVASRLWELLSFSLKETLPSGSVTLVAAHDLGKLTPGFQTKATEWEYCDRVLAATIGAGLCSNHAIVSQKHLSDHLISLGRKDAEKWCVSTGGHHGRYPCGFRSLRPRMAYEGGNESFVPLRNELLDALVALFGPLPEEPVKKRRERLHLLTGFTIFADWIGSNSDWFPADHSTEMEALRATADRALESLRWRSRPKRGLSFGELFCPVDPDTFTPRGIQTALLDAVDSPGLYIVEAPMGLGKTEAALAAAYKRWSLGDEHGLYFALPTQLTSNKIHERVEAFLEQCVGEPYVHSLAHGNAWLKDHVSRKLWSVRGDVEESEEANDIEDALRWYSGAKRRLLAPFGSGTIDQALLAVLPAKHAALRYFALAGKVVVIDEVHSYDAYMTALIQRLIGYLIKAGCSVIVLSATLTAAQRKALVEAAGRSEETSPVGYPLITKVARGSESAEHIEVACDLPGKSVRVVNHFGEADDRYWEEIAAKVEQGANVVVIRNTVALAQETYLRLKSCLSEAVPRDNVGLLHSRFPQNERDANEGKWTELLGKGQAKRPQGSLLVSTQIVEQSVDIDADLLVTDLAPVDLILQRMGRLHRHARPRPAGFQKPVCHLLHPVRDWSGSAREIRTALSPHSYIYRPLELWRAQKVLLERAEVCLPRQIRELLETAYSLYPKECDGKGLYEYIDESARELRSKIAKVRTRDVFNVHAIEGREGLETRDGMQPTALLVLLSKLPLEQAGVTEIVFADGEAFHVKNGVFSYPLARALHLRATRVPLYLVKAQAGERPEWLQQHLDEGVIAVLPEDDTRLVFPGELSSGYALHYRPDLGVSHEKEALQLEPSYEEEFWY